MNTLSPLPSASKFLLCSTSPRRLQILQQLGFDPIVVASQFDENLDKSLSPQVYVQETATGKMMAVWNTLQEKVDGTLLLACDTVVANEGRIYEKPKTFEENRRVLREIRDSNEPVYVHSGLVVLVIDSTESIGYRMRRSIVTTTIHMNRRISDKLIDEYCSTGEGLEVAGGFKIQGKGMLLMDGIEGDYYNVVGLPGAHTFEEISKLVGATTSN